MAEVRRWEDLKYDCLVSIIRRVGVVSLLLDVPFVCKSWHEASLDPTCWQHLDCALFTQDSYTFDDYFCGEHVRRFLKEYRAKKFSIGGFTRLMVARGFGNSTSIALPTGWTKDLYHISETCHELTSLSFGFCGTEKHNVIPKLIGKWKHLEELSITNVHPRMLFNIVCEIKENCKKFYGFSICRGRIDDEVAKAIANHLPKIRKLSLKYCYVKQKNLEMIIKGCKDLEILDVECEYEDSWDDEKLKELAGHINTFKIDAYPYFDVTSLDVVVDDGFAD